MAAISAHGVSGRDTAAHALPEAYAWGDRTNSLRSFNHRANSIRSSNYRANSIRSYNSLDTTTPLSSIDYAYVPPLTRGNSLTSTSSKPPTPTPVNLSTGIAQPDYLEHIKIVEEISRQRAEDRISHLVHPAKHASIINVGSAGKYAAGFAVSCNQDEAHKLLTERDSFLASSQTHETLTNLARARANNTILELTEQAYYRNPTLNPRYYEAALAIAEERSRERLENYCKVDIGGGVFMSQRNIDEIAERNVRPVLNEISERVQAQRLEDEERRVAEQEAVRQESERKIKEQEEKVMQQRAWSDQKAAEKAIKNEEKKKAKKSMKRRSIISMLRSERASYDRGTIMSISPSTKLAETSGDDKSGQPQSELLPVKLESLKLDTMTSSSSHSLQTQSVSTQPQHDQHQHQERQEQLYQQEHLPQEHLQEEQEQFKKPAAVHAKPRHFILPAHARTSTADHDHHHHHHHHAYARRRHQPAAVYNDHDVDVDVDDSYLRTPRVQSYDNNSATSGSSGFQTADGLSVSSSSLGSTAGSGSGSSSQIPGYQIEVVAPLSISSPTPVRLLYDDQSHSVVTTIDQPPQLLDAGILFQDNTNSGDVIHPQSQTAANHINTNTNTNINNLKLETHHHEPQLFQHHACPTKATKATPKMNITTTTTPNLNTTQSRKRGWIKKLQSSTGTSSKANSAKSLKSSALDPTTSATNMKFASSRPPVMPNFASVHSLLRNSK